MRLMREIRFFLSDQNEPTATTNNWSGTGASSLGQYLTLRAVVEGEADPESGYLCNIKVVESLLKDRILSTLTVEAAAQPFLAGTCLNRELESATIDCENPVRLVELELAYSPYVSVTTSKDVPGMIQLTQSFEFSAAHRLFRPNLSDDENAKLFGKCANPHGHGHNYVVDVTVTHDKEDASDHTPRLDIPTFDRIVDELVIDRFDHKHLNIDCAEFSTLN
ncbi:MAG: 6-carboxytetrahydropterin synthase, partial [Phycisphaerae bacterium]